MRRGPLVKPGGVSESFSPLAHVEAYASTCSHCQHISEFPSMRRMMEHVELCRGCMKLICLQCAGQPCRPYEKEAERQEAEYRLRQRIERGW
jgi:hypothetical protein